MTTKDGSSLSQSKTHAQTEDDINQADRRFIQRILNTELLPRLEKRGYPVAGGFFHFAEKGENLTKEQELNIAEKVEQITGQVDEQYWFENFGIPKGKAKKDTKPKEPTTPPEKKEKEEQKLSRHFEPVEASNKSLFKRLRDFFVKAPHSGATSGARLSNSTTDISIEKLLQKALLEIYNGDTELVNRLLFEINNNRLQQGINLAFQEAGEDWRIENSAFINEFRYNTAVFAAFKNHQQTKELIEELIDENGELRSFREFRKATKNIVKDYNERWLQTEYNTAVRSARSAVKWKEFLKTEHLYPNLEYMRSRATHKREAHLDYVGTILPIRHPWWDTHLPPGDWNCKCWVRPTDKEPTGIPNAELVLPVFAGNPGKTAEFVNLKEHPYVKGVCKHFNECMRRKLSGNAELAQKNPPRIPQCAICELAKSYAQNKRRIAENKKKYEKLDKRWEKVFFDEKKGGYLAIDKKRIKAAELSKNEQKKLHKEKRVATVYAQNGNRIELWEEDLRLSSPDGSINNVPMDLKSLESHNNIIKYAKKAIRKQGAEIVLFEFETINKYIHKELNKLTDLGIKYQYFARNKKKVYRNY